MLGSLSMMSRSSSFLGFITFPCVCVCVCVRSVFVRLLDWVFVYQIEGLLYG